ncbi:MAG: hypothetical protein RR942_17815 [Romboutsia sp.]
MKRNLLFTLIICMFITGCTLEKDIKTHSLKEKYFYIVEKNEDTGLEVKDIKEILKEYDIQKLNKEEINQTEYICNNNNEKLTIATEKNNENIVRVIYSIEHDAKEEDVPSPQLSVDYYAYEDSSEFIVSCNTNNIDTFKRISKLTDYKDSSYLKVYNNVVEDMCTENKLTFESIKNKIDEKPKVKNYTEDLLGDNNIFEMTRYLYQNKNENMTINYIDKEKKVGRTIYTRLNKEGLPSLLKGAYITNINSNNVLLTVSTNLDSLEEQEEILNKF